MRDRISEGSQRIKDSPCLLLLLGVPQVDQNCHIYVESLDQSHAVSLVAGSDSRSSYAQLTF